MTQHIVANITWQENYWTANPSEEDMQRAGHRWVSEGNIGHEYLNFNLERNVKDGFKVGFFQSTKQPTRFSNGVGNVFFYSKGYIVGVYGQAEMGDFKMEESPDLNTRANVRAPIDQVCRFKDIKLLHVDPMRHLGGKQRVGMIGFTYIDDNAARAILEDAIARHQEGFEYRNRLESVLSRLNKPSDRRHGNKASREKELEQVLSESRNVILYGPPGTGKTYRIRQFAEGCTQGQISESDTPARRYWCVVANPKEWHWDVLFGQKTVEAFRRGRLKRNYGDVQPGDLVFGYLAHPHKQLYCLSEIVAPPKKESSDIGFYVKGIKKLSMPLGWQALREDTLLQGSEPVRFRMQGTLFRLEFHEAGYLRELIENSEPELADVFERYWTQDPVEYVHTVTFHQSYGYEDFVEGLRPIPDKQGNIRYEWRPGIFKQMCDDAAADPDNDYILVIDEINRGNMAKILGELITLLEDDKRLGKENEMTVTLPGSQQRFGVPDNLYVLGTMNTADRSIAILDVALRRRFTFVQAQPDPSLLEGQVIEGIPLDGLLIRLNARIEALLDRDHCLGHSYLMGINSLNRLHFVWYRRIVPLLQEYFYNDWVRLQAVLDDFVDRDEAIANVFTHSPEMLDPDMIGYHVAELSGTQFVAALNKIVGQ